MMHAVVPPCAISPLGRGLAPKPINDTSFPRLSLCWRPQQRHRRTHNVVPTRMAAQDNGDAGNDDGYDRPTRILHQTSFNDWSKTYVNEKGILVCVCVRVCMRLEERVVLGVQSPDGHTPGVDITHVYRSIQKQSHRLAKSWLPIVVKLPHVLFEPVSSLACALYVCFVYMLRGATSDRNQHIQPTHLSPTTPHSWQYTVQLIAYPHIASRQTSHIK